MVNTEDPGMGRGAELGVSLGEEKRTSLRVSLLAGAIYDLALGGFILVLGPGLMESLGRPIADHAAFYFFLGTIPLFVLPVLYLTAARSAAVDVFRPAVLWARGGGGGLVLLFTVLLHPGVPWLFALLGGMDLVWAAVHARLWRGQG